MRLLPRACIMRITGKVSSGLGRAHVFMSQKHYQSQFKRVLGVSAWPGTLNVDLEGQNENLFRELRVIAGLEEGESFEKAKPLRINGFERDGSHSAEPPLTKPGLSVDDVGWEDCAILIPDLTRHTSTAEVISGAFLRESLPCSDGDIVNIELS